MLKEALSFLQLQLSAMQWSDYLDIIVVAFLIYKFLPLFRSSGTMRIAKVVIAVVVITSLSTLLKLHALSFILNQFLAVGLIAVVVLFQPELRRMLDHLGSIKFKAFLAPEKKRTGDGTCGHSNCPCL